MPTVDEVLRKSSPGGRGRSAAGVFRRNARSLLRAAPEHGGQRDFLTPKGAALLGGPLCGLCASSPLPAVSRLRKSVPFGAGETITRSGNCACLPSKGGMIVSAGRSRFFTRGWSSPRFDCPGCGDVKRASQDHPCRDIDHLPPKVIERPPMCRVHGIGTRFGRQLLYCGCGMNPVRRHVAVAGP